MSNYGLLNRKNIIEILDGDVEVIKKDEYKGSMPYLSDRHWYRCVMISGWIQVMALKVDGYIYRI